MTDKDWYEKKIEKPIMNLVKILRDNGFNTICSCGHYPEPYIQMETYSPYEVEQLCNLLEANGFKNYTIHLYWKNIDFLKDYGKCLEIRFTIEERRRLVDEENIRNG